MRKLLGKLFLVLFLGLLCTFFLHTVLKPQTEVTDPDKEWLKTQTNRTNLMNFLCQKVNFLRDKIKPGVAQKLFVDNNHRVIYCEVPKVGCSNWKKIVLLLTLNLSRDPAEVNQDTIHKTKLLKNLSSYPPKEQATLLNNYTKVMFSRHPLERLVSAYRDKILHSEPYYVSVANEIKTLFRGDKNSKVNVTFPEFVNFILTRIPNNLDIHWKPMFMLCDPCNIKYDILGKYETLGQDTDHVLQRIGAPDFFHLPDHKTHASENRTNSNITLSYLRELNDSQMEKLRDLYRMDFILFNYSFSLRPHGHFNPNSIYG